MEEKSMEYNPKIQYLAIKFTNQEMPTIYDEKQWKKIYKEKLPPITKEHYEMMKVKNIYKTFLSKEFGLMTVLKIYENYTNEKLGSNNLEKLKDCLRMENREKNLVEQSYEIFCEIVEEEIFKVKSVEMAKIITNWYRLKKGSFPVVFYPKHTQEMLNTFIGDYKKGFIIFNELVMRTEKLNQRHAPMEIQTVIEKLKNVQNDLKSIYLVKELYVYGSYSKNEANEYSDLDLLAVLEQNQYDLYKFQGYMEHFLETKIKIPMDVKVQLDRLDLKKLTVDTARSIKKIF